MWVAFQYGTIEDGPKVLHWLDEALRAQEDNFLLQAKPLLNSTFSARTHGSKSCSAA